MAGIPRRAAKRDANEKPIIEALITAGCSVEQLSMRGVADLLVGCTDIHTGEQRNLLMEIKAPKGKLTDDEQMFFARWKGQVAVVRSVEEAIALVRGKRR